MNAIRRAVAATELLLVFPASLFMAALFVRQIEPPQCEPAHTAQRLVDWFTVRPILGLDILLITLPFAALVIGGITIFRSWQSDAELRQAAVETMSRVRLHLAELLIAASTLLAAAILAVVALHVITD